MIMLTEVKDPSQLYCKSEVMCITICDFPGHFFKKEECEEVTYRVYSVVTILQAYFDVLSGDIKKHISWVSDHEIMKSNGIHCNALVLIKSLNHFDLLAMYKKF